MVAPKVRMGTKGSELTDIIINIIHKHQPIKSRQIYKTAVKNYDVNVTYQAVFKKLKQMAEIGIVKRDGTDYTLNIEWIREIKSFADKAEKSFIVSNKSLDDIEEEQNVVITFNTLIEALNYLLDFLVDQYEKNNTADTTVVHWAHPWPIICVSKEQYEKIRKIMKKGKHYSLCRGNTMLDHWLSKMWEEFGKQSLFNMNCATNRDTLIFRNYVVEVFLTPEMSSIIENIFNTTKDVNKLDIAVFYKNVMERKTKIKTIVTKNSFIANKVRSETIQHFKK